MSTNNYMRFTKLTYRFNFNTTETIIVIGIPIVFYSNIMRLYRSLLSVITNIAYILI